MFLKVLIIIQETETVKYKQKRFGIINIYTLSVTIIVIYKVHAFIQCV